MVPAPPWPPTSRRKWNGSCGGIRGGSSTSSGGSTTATEAAGPERRRPMTWGNQVNHAGVLGGKGFGGGIGALKAVTE